MAWPAFFPKAPGNQPAEPSSSPNRRDVAKVAAAGLATWILGVFGLTVILSFAYRLSQQQLEGLGRLSAIWLPPTLPAFAAAWYCGRIAANICSRHHWSLSRPLSGAGVALGGLCSVLIATTPAGSHDRDIAYESSAFVLLPLLIALLSSIDRARLRWLAITGAVGGPAALLALMGGYEHHMSACYSDPKGYGCDRFVALQRTVCDLGGVSNRMLAACSDLAARYEMGMGLPTDVGRAVGYWRRGCVSEYESTGGVERPCTMAWTYYTGAAYTPRFILQWSHQLGDPDSQFTRSLDDLIAESEHLCATDFASASVTPKVHDLLRKFCDDLPKARAGRDDARDHGAELLPLCERGSRNACHLIGLMLAYGVGMPGDLARGKALLKHACDDGQDLACTDLGKDRPSWLLDGLEAASKRSRS